MELGFSCELWVFFLLSGKGLHWPRGVSVCSPHPPGSQLSECWTVICLGSVSWLELIKPKSSLSEFPELLKCWAGSFWPREHAHRDFLIRASSPKSSSVSSSSSQGLQSDELPKKSEDHKGLWHRQGKQSWFSQLWNPSTQARHQILAPVQSWAGSWRRAQRSKQTPWGNKDTLWLWWFNWTLRGGLFKAWIKSLRKKKKRFVTSKF